MSLPNDNRQKQLLALAMEWEGEGASLPITLQRLRVLAQRIAKKGHMDVAVTLLQAIDELELATTVR